jgi:hypothetical protein
MIHVYLDDYRPRPAGFVLARTIGECVLLLDSEEIDILSLDYDLGWGQPTGFEVAMHIVATGRYPRRIYLHTSSPSGRMQMYGLLMEHAPQEVMLHNGPMPDQLVQAIGSKNREAE